MKRYSSPGKLVVHCLVVALSGALAAPVAWAAGPSTPAVERGGYLVGIGSCNDCHTPSRMGPKGPEKDRTHLLAGHPGTLPLSAPPQLDHGDWNWAGSSTMTAFVGPWGVSYAANLTPDVETGLGKWTVREFVRAMRTGKHAGVGRPIMPPMPWPSLAKLNDRDLHAIFAYLRSLPAIRNAVPAYQPPAAR